ncbi:MAG: DUF2061 domain-containing protein [Xanthobacteraceae bacterium]
MKFDNHAASHSLVSMSVGGQGEGLVSGVARGQDARSRSLLKAISWRLTGTLDTFVIGFIVTGKASIAGSIAATELFSKIALYYGHERMWALTHWGRS